MITLEMLTQGCNFSIYHVCVSNYTYKLTCTLKVFATVRNIGMEFYFPHLTTVLPILLFCHLPVLICLLMQFSQSWTLVSGCGAMLMISSFYIYTIYGMCICIYLSLYIYSIAFETRQCKYGTKKENNPHVIISYFAAGFLNKKCQMQIPPYLQEIHFWIYELLNCTTPFSVNAE